MGSLARKLRRQSEQRYTVRLEAVGDAPALEAHIKKVDYRSMLFRTGVVDGSFKGVLVQDQQAREEAVQDIMQDNPESFGRLLIASSKLEEAYLVLGVRKLVEAGAESEDAIKLTFTAEADSIDDESTLTVETLIDLYGADQVKKLDQRIRELSGAKLADELKGVEPNSKSGAGDREPPAEGAHPSDEVLN